MPASSNPSEIARETLKQLTARRMPPSPDNYQAIYNEIAGIDEASTADFPERELKSLIAALPDASAAQQRLARQLEQSLKAENWDDYRKTLIDFITEHSTESTQNWGELIGEFLHGRGVAVADSEVPDGDEDLELLGSRGHGNSP